MPEKTRSPLPQAHSDPIRDMHSEAWWIRLMEDDLTPVERDLWEAHLRQCASCRQEWAALAVLDESLRIAPPPPSLPPGFAAKTTQKIMQKQRLRRLLTFLVGGLVVGVVAFLVLGYAGLAFNSLGQNLAAFVAARQMIFRSVVHALVGLLVGWRALLPVILGAVVLACFLVMPNGLMMTVVVVWLSGRRRSAALS